MKKFYLVIIALSLLTACTNDKPAQVIKKGGKAYTKKHPNGIPIDSPYLTETVEESSDKLITHEDGYFVTKETRRVNKHVDEDGYLKSLQDENTNIEEPQPVKLNPDDAARDSKLKPLDRELIDEDGNTVVERHQDPAVDASAAISNEPEAHDLSDLTANVRDPSTSGGSNFLLAHPRGNPNLQWPLDGNVISRFGKNGNKFNDGINISAPMGTPVRASGDGKVIYVGNSVEGYGNLVIIKHSNDIMTAYAHLNDLSVVRDAKIKAGDVIGTIGKSGNVASPQMHFSVRIGKKTVNPETTK